jgi:hypothetical protein
MVALRERLPGTDFRLVNTRTADAISGLVDQTVASEKLQHTRSDCLVRCSWHRSLGAVLAGCTFLQTENDLESISTRRLF